MLYVDVGISCGIDICIFFLYVVFVDDGIRVLVLEVACDMFVTVTV